MAICLYGSSHQDIFICINHFETFLEIPFLLLSEIIAGKAIMRSLEWPHLSPLQALHHHHHHLISPFGHLYHILRWDYVLLTLTLPHTRAQHTSFLANTWYSLHLETHVHPFILPSFSVVYELCVKSPRTFLFPHPNDFWIINPLLPLEFSQDFQASAR